VKIALVDYGAGNLRSVENALRSVGAGVEVTHDPERARAADALVVPGQGAMPACVKRLLASGLATVIREGVAAGKPVLGICVGLQVLFDEGEEAGGCAGLGLVAGKVTKLPETVRLPHIGWSRVARGPAPHPFFEPLVGRHLYFAHSFAAPAGAPGTALVAEHGRPFCAAIAQGSLFAVQFHPEKSQQTGLDLLRRFAQG
jgi:glutamine amidotransferase